MTSIVIQDLGLGPALLRAIQKRAKAEGKTTPQYIRSLIERDLRAGKSFDEILKPFREDVRKRGISEEQLNEIVEQARTASHRQRRGAGR